MKKKVGRPTKYKPEYCQKIIDYFSVKHYDKEEKEAADLPQFATFATMLGVSRETLHEWKRNHKEFSDAYNQCVTLQEALIANNAIKNRYNPYFAQFMLKNCHGWSDKKEVEHSNKSIEEIVREGEK